jgi:hypothetical protein
VVAATDRMTWLIVLLLLLIPGIAANLLRLVGFVILLALLAPLFTHS